MPNQPESEFRQNWHIRGFRISETIYEYMSKVYSATSTKIKQFLGFLENSEHTKLFIRSDDITKCGNILENYEYHLREKIQGNLRKSVRKFEKITEKSEVSLRGDKVNV